MADGYTKTGNNFGARVSNGVTKWLGWMGGVPLLGGVVKAIASFGGAVGSLLDGGYWLLKGKPLSAATAVGAGAVDTAVNVATVLGGPVWWAVNLGSSLITGQSLGTHARKATETVISVATKPLGMQPTVLRSYPAGIGSIGGGQVPSQPGRWASGVSNQRGQDPQAAYANYMGGEGGVHVNQLASANGRGA